MFKRVVKRVKRKEKEAALGITEEMKEVMGLQDTDSDESQSDSEEDTTVTANLSRKRKRDEDGDSTAEEIGDEPEEDQLAAISVRDALEAPVRDTSCIVCPGKTIKHSKMEQVHLDSAHHKRRMKRFKELTERLLSQFEDIYSDSATLVVQLMNEESPAKGLRESEGLSNREKKKQKLRAQREKRKQKQRLSEDINALRKDSTSQPKKKKHKSAEAATVESKSPY